MFEMRVFPMMSGRQREFEPDPVPANYSARERIAVESDNVMRRCVIIGVNRFVNT